MVSRHAMPPRQHAQRVMRLTTPIPTETKRAGPLPCLPSQPRGCKTRRSHILLTKISATTALVTAVANLLTLFGVVELSSDQVAGINLVIVAAGTAVHAWFNPAVPFGAGE